jgi:ribonuclease Z
MLDVALLGTGGMMPLPNRFLTSLLLRFNGRYLMVDCGEATQITLKLLGWGYKNIDTICITHLHADHIAGLPGLLLTIGNSGREEPLTLLGPPGLAKVARCLCVIAQEVPFDIKVVEVPFTRGGDPVSITIGDYNISALPLEHRIPCFGYSFTFKRSGRFNIERAKANGVPLKAWNHLQKYETVEMDGHVYTPDMVLGPERTPIKLTYCTDSRPVPKLPEFAMHSDLFICEGLYGEADKQEKAAAHMHMSFQEAAAAARDAEAGELWLTHFSPALTDPAAYIQSARNIFPAARVGRDRLTKTINFREDE